jgi:glycosyltransferase involved in cell wall biosynthesis
MENTPKITIVVPVYNGEKFVKDSYESVLGQELDNYDLIYIDNNSTDNSVAEIEKILAIEPKARFFRETVQGSAAVKNRGIREAYGEYVYLYDVDDQIFPGALKAMQAVLDKHPEVAAVFGKMYKSRMRMQDIELPIEPEYNIIIKEKPYWGLHWFRSLKNVVGTPGFLYRKKTFDEIGFYEEQLITGQDTAFDVRLGMSCKVAHIDRYVYLYFRHSDSISQVTQQKMDRVFMSWPRFTQSHLKFYLENEVPTEFKNILFKGIYSSMGRMLHLSRHYSKRRLLKEKLLQDITPLKTPWPIEIYLNLLVVFNFPYVFKFYIYYLIPKLLPDIIKMNDKQLNKV